MKNIFLLSMVLALSTTLADLSFGANEGQLKGTVTAIKGDQMTIRDDNGKETTVEISLSGIQVGDPVLMKYQIYKSRPTAKLTPQEVKFLTEQCQVLEADVNVIPKLNEETREYLYSLVDKRNCKDLEPFKSTREFLRKFTPPPEKSPFPPKGFKNDYLTEEESNYINDINKRILDKAFKDFGGKH